MKPVALTLSVVVVAALTTGAGQEKPSFSGTWTMVDSSTKRSTTMVVTQGADSMILEVTQRGKDTVRYAFSIDDTESKNPGSTEAPAGKTGMVSRATWEGANLILSLTPSSSAESSRVLKQTWSLVDGNLVITLSEINQATGAVLRETKQTFKRN